MRIRPMVTTLFLAVLTLLVLGVVPSVGAQNSGKQRICHQTGSDKNPEVGIDVSNNAKGHDDPHGNDARPAANKGPSFKGGGGCDGGGGNGAEVPKKTRRTTTTVTSGAAAAAAAIEGEPTVTG